jgi:hypothetical protein
MKRRRRKKGVCARPAKRARSSKWAAFKRKHTKPGMGKAAYKKAVALHWKPTARVITRKKRTCQSKAPSRRRRVPKRNVKGRFTRSRRAQRAR